MDKITYPRFCWIWTIILYLCGYGKPISTWMLEQYKDLGKMHFKSWGYTNLKFDEIKNESVMCLGLYVIE